MTRGTRALMSFFGTFRSRISLFCGRYQGINDCNSDSARDSDSDSDVVKVTRARVSFSRELQHRLLCYADISYSAGAAWNARAAWRKFLRTGDSARNAGRRYPPVVRFAVVSIRWAQSSAAIAVRSSALRQGWHDRTCSTSPLHCNRLRTPSGGSSR